MVLRWYSNQKYYEKRKKNDSSGYSPSFKGASGKI